MYSLKPYYDFSNLTDDDINSTMYKLRSFHDNSFIPATNLTNSSEEDIDYCQIEKRQATLLAVLNDLETEIDQVLIKHNIQMPSDLPTQSKVDVAPPLDKKKAAQVSVEATAISVTGSDAAAVGISPSDFATSKEMVIHCNQKELPFSIKMMLSILSSKYSFSIRYFLHSSIQSGADEYNCSWLLDKSTAAENRPNVKISCSVIFKQDVWDNVCLILDPVKQSTAICGEAALCRYLAIFLPELYGDLSITDQIRCDYIIDSFYYAHMLRDGHKLNDIATNEIARLKKNSMSFLIGNKLSLADVMAQSVLRQNEGLIDAKFLKTLSVLKC